MGSSIFVLLLAPDAWARGCGPWFTMLSVSCPVVGRPCAVAPCLLCEVLAVILVLGCGVGACARSCVAPASELWFLGASLPSTGFVVAVLVRGCPVLLAWTVPCFSLGAWALARAASSVAFLPSPSLESARRVVLGSVSTSLEMASLFFHGLVVAHFLGISRSVFGCV